VIKVDDKEQLPSQFSRYFWDVSLDSIFIYPHRRFIIERLLNEGDLQSLQWLIKQYGMEQIRQTVCEARGLTRFTARFWQGYFKLREDEMRCFSTSWMSNESMF
jgi:hypothetical protein